MDSLRKLVREIIKEDQAYKRLTGSRYTADIEMFRDTVDKPGYYIHLSDEPKLGINPTSVFLPGLYLYPNTKANYMRVFSLKGPGGIPDISAGAAARYVFLVKLRDDLKLISDDDSASLSDKIDKRYKDIVVPVLDEMLDVNIMSDPQNRGTYFDAQGKLRDVTLLSSRKLAIVTPEMIEKTGSTILNDMIEQLLSVEREISSLTSVRGSVRVESAKEINGKLTRLLDKLGVPYQVIDGAPMRPAIGSKKDAFYGVGVNKNGLVGDANIRRAREGMRELLGDMVRVDAETGQLTYDPSWKSTWMGDMYKPFYRGKNIMSNIHGIYDRTAELYARIAGASGPESRAAAIHEILRDLNSRAKVLGKEGQVIAASDVSRRLRDALCTSLSYPGYEVSPKRLARFSGATEELNIMLALSTGDFDGVRDMGRFEKSEVQGRMYHAGGSLGVERRQTYIKPPIMSKLEGGGPVVMIDRFVGLAPGETPAGSKHGTDITQRRDKNEREQELRRRAYVTDDEAHRANLAGASDVTPGKSRERISTALDFPDAEETSET
jgi:hypothetical protein